MRISYITFNESVNGVYISQVIEVAKKLKQTGHDVEIIAFFSLRDFWINRNILKQNYSNSFTIPSLPRLKFWKLNKFWFRLLHAKFNKNKALICRGPLATNLAIYNTKNTRVIYDARGAVWAEQQEYGVFDGSGIENDLFEIEKRAIFQSHQQIAVSLKLINYWQENFSFFKNTATIIPCTIDTHKTVQPKNIPDKLNYFITNAHQKGCPIVVFAGGNGKWQQLEKICDFATRTLEKQDIPVFLLLCPPDKNVLDLLSKFPNRVFSTLISPDLVHTVLTNCDYGLILREQNTTNNVASPIKVAEYLFAGLKIIISSNLGDYSEMIRINDLGIICNAGKELPELSMPNKIEKLRNTTFAEQNLSKLSIDYSFLTEYS